MMVRGGARKSSVAGVMTAAAMLATMMAAGPAMAQDAETVPATAEQAQPSEQARPTQPAAPQGFTQLPTSAFAQLPFIESARLSPDGTHMAGLLGTEGEQLISIMPLTGDRSAAVAIRVPDQTEVSSIRWVGNDNIIVRLYALLPVQGDRWYVSRLIGVDRQGKITKLLWDSAGQNAANVLWVPRDGSTEILVAAQYSIYSNYPDFWPTVYSVDVTTGRKRVVERGRTNVMNWGADHLGRVRFGIGYRDNTTRSTLHYRAINERTLREIDRATLIDDESLTVPFHFLPDTDRGYVIKERASGKSAVVEIDIPTGADVRTVYEADSIEGTIMAPDGSRLLGVYVNDPDAPVRWIDPVVAAHQQKLQEASPRSHVRIESFSNDLTEMLVRLSTPDNPGLLYFYETESGHLSELAAMNTAIGRTRLSRARLVQFKARDGLEIEGVLTMPRQRGDTNMPLIVMPHGGPWAHDTLGYDYWPQFLAERGYVVLQPNFRGSTGYGDAFERAGQGQMGLAMQDDITDAVRWAVAEGIADPARVCIMGASYGGYAAMWGIAKDPDLYRCAISINGVSNLRREVNDFGGTLRERLSRSRWERMTPDFAAVSPINAVAQISTPLLLIHGKRDVTVDHVQSERMNAAMRRAGKEVEFVSIPLADHYFTRAPDRLTLLTSIETFLGKHNPAD